MMFASVRATGCHFFRAGEYVLSELISLSKSVFSSPVLGKAVAAIFNAIV